MLILELMFWFREVDLYLISAPRHYLSESSANKTSANVEIFVSMSMCCVPDLSQWDSEPETGAFVSCNDISNPGHAARN